LWPPDPPPLGVPSSDCSYEDLSAPLNVIAQRAYNDEARRQRGEVSGATSSLAHRALTASYLVDFAHEVGATLPPVPETFSVMLEELELRAGEWEQPSDSASAPSASSGLLPSSNVGATLTSAAALLGGISFGSALEQLRSLDAQRLVGMRTGRSTMSTGDGLDGAPDSEGSGAPGHDLVLDGLAACGLGSPEGRAAAAQRIYLELELADGQCARTAAFELAAEGACSAAFPGESLSFSYAEQPELAVRLLSRGRLGALFRGGDTLLGEALLPLGPELRDCTPRRLALPLSLGLEHAGTVSLRLFLRLRTEPPCEAPGASSGEGPPHATSHSRLSSLASAGVGISMAAGSAVGSAAGAVVGAVGGAVGAAVSASLRPRSGFGTCSLPEAEVASVPAA